MHDSEHISEEFPTFVFQNCGGGGGNGGGSSSGGGCVYVKTTYVISVEADKRNLFGNDQQLPFLCKDNLLFFLFENIFLT